MRHAALVVVALYLALPSAADAHVGVRPRESRPAADERYTVRVPTEGAVATTSVRLEIPDGVSVLDVEPADGARSETEQRGNRIVAIIWRKVIDPKAVAEFHFRARNPSVANDLVWKAHQHFADGTVVDWVGPAGDRRPAPVTKLSSTPGAQSAAAADALAVESWLKGYDAAFNAKDLEKLATFYHPDVTIYEGAGINNGWLDYRDRHLGPELKAFQNLQFSHSDTTVTLLPGGQSAYATSRYALKAKMGDREIDSEGLASYVLIKSADGTWKIRHSHTSSRPARRPAQ